MMKCLTILFDTSLALPLPAGAAGSNLSKKRNQKSSDYLRKTQVRKNQDRTAARLETAIT